MDLNTSLVALADSDSGFGAGRIVKTNQTTEDKLRFYRGTFNLGALLDVGGILLASQSQDTQTKTGQRCHVGEDFVTELLSDRLRLLLAIGEVGGTALDNALYGTLGESVVATCVFHDNGHALDVGIERKLNKILPRSRIALYEMATVHTESRCENLDSDFGGISVGLPCTFVVLLDGS